MMFDGKLSVGLTCGEVSSHPHSFLPAYVLLAQVDRNHITQHSPCPARKLQTAAPAPWQYPCASLRRWTETSDREKSLLRLSPSHRRFLVQPTPRKSSERLGHAPYRCPLDRQEQHEPSRPAQPRERAAIVSVRTRLPSRSNRLG